MMVRSYDIRFSINSPDVVQDTIDGEAVIVNLRTGHYYSLEDTGAQIWGLIERGYALQDMIEWICLHYEADRNVVERSVTDLVEQLCKEELLVTGNGHSSQTEVSPPPKTSTKNRFEEPTLKKYTDMQDILLLDPIHDVDESGWPNIRIQKGD